LLKHPTLDQLHALGLYACQALCTNSTRPRRRKGFDRHDWLRLAAGRGGLPCGDKRLTRAGAPPKLRQPASVEDVDYRAALGLDRAVFQKLAEGA